MTNEPSAPNAPPGSGAPVGPGNGCPGNEVLSAYLDGRLDPAERGPIEEHISRCEDCYFVVKETAAAQVETGSVGGPKKLVRDYILPIAATLIVSAGVLALWGRARPGEAYLDAVQPLVEAVGERRFFEPRLTGGFKYGPRVTSKRSQASGSDAATWKVLAVAGELRARSGSSSPGARGGRAAAALLAGDVDEAIAIYLELLREDKQNADWPSNLAAALLVRATGEGAAPDSQGSAERERAASDALGYADAALRLDPTLPEARFNRALALKALGRADEARQAFAEIERLGGSWSAAAGEQLRDVTEAPLRRP